MYPRETFTYGKTCLLLLLLRFRPFIFPRKAPKFQPRFKRTFLFLSSLSNSIARFSKKKFIHYRGKIEEEERVSFRSFTYFYIPRSIPRAKLSTAVDISRYEWAATPTIFPSSCYAVSFFDGSPAHAIYLSREGEGEEPTSK